MGRLEYTKPNNSVTLEWNWKKCFKWDCVISFVPYNRRSNDYQLMGSAEYRSKDAPPPPAPPSFPTLQRTFLFRGSNSGYYPTTFS